jgi:hypothetical protein
MAFIVLLSIALAQARTLSKMNRTTSSSAPVVDLKQQLPHAAGAIDLQQLAFLRIGALRRWSGSSECKQLLVMTAVHVHS